MYDTTRERVLRILRENFNTKKVRRRSTGAENVGTAQKKRERVPGPR